MSFYDVHVLPYVLNLAMRHKDLASYRARLVPAARGRVLEIGIGSGLNLPFYSGQAVEVIGLDPSSRLLTMAEGRVTGSMPSVRMVEGSAEAMPLEDASFDTVVTTWSLCSIPKAEAALAEVRRVLKPSGELLFIEHGRAPDRSVSRWQDRLTPLWKPLAGGCHLNRSIDTLIRQSGFVITDLRSAYMPGPKLFTFMYEGRATRA